MSYFKFGNIIKRLNSTVSSGGTLTLFNTSQQYQLITGTLTHTVQLPDATTCANGLAFTVINTSTGSVSVNDTSSTLIQTLNKGQSAEFVVSDTSVSTGFTNNPGVSSSGSSSGSVGQYQNLLGAKNADAEQGSTTNWTNSGGTLSVISSGQADGTYSFRFVSSGGSQTVSSASVAVPAASYGKAGLLRLTYSTSNSDFVLQVYDGTNVIATQTLPSTSGYQYGSTTLLMPSSGNVQMRLVSASAGTIDFDDVYLGENFQVSQVSQAYVYGSLNYVGAVSCSWSNTSSTFADFSANTNCNAPVVTGSIAAPGTKVLQAIANNLPPASYEVSFSGTMANSSGSTWCRLIDDLSNVIDAKAESVGTGGTPWVPLQLQGIVTYTTSGNRTFKVQCRNNDGTTSNIIQNQNSDMVATFTIKKFPSQSQIAVTPDTTAMSWNGYQTIISGWSTSSTPFADPSAGSGIVLTQLSSSNFPTVSSAGSSLSGITFTPTLAGKYKVCVSGNFIGSTSGTAAARIVDGSGTIVHPGQTVYLASTNATAIPQMCGDYTISSTSSAVTFKIQLATTGPTINLTNGTPTSAALIWTVQNITQNIPGPVLQNQVTTNNSGVERIERATIANAGAPSITRQSGSWVSSLTYVATGRVQLNFAAGMFSAAPSCIVTNNDGTTNRAYITSGASTSSVLVHSYNLSNVYQDNGFDIICMGPK